MSDFEAGDENGRDQDAASHAGGSEKRAVCVICAAPSTQRYKPFCSKRCADVDLHRWLTGAYSIEGTAPPDPEA